MYIYKLVPHTTEGKSRSSGVLVGTLQALAFRNDSLQLQRSSQPRHDEDLRKATALADFLRSARAHDLGSKLLEGALQSFIRASDRDYNLVHWRCGHSSFDNISQLTAATRLESVLDHPFVSAVVVERQVGIHIPATSFRNTNGSLPLSNTDLLHQPNIEWSAWVVQMLMDAWESDHRNLAAKAAFDSCTFKALIASMNTPNMSLKYVILRLCSRVLHHVRRRVLLALDHAQRQSSNTASGSDNKQTNTGKEEEADEEEGMSVTEALRYVRLIPHSVLLRVYSRRFAKENSSRTIASPFLGTLGNFLVSAHRLSQAVYTLGQATGEFSPSPPSLQPVLAPPTTDASGVKPDPSASTVSSDAAMDLIVLTVEPTRVVLGWGGIPAHLEDTAVRVVLGRTVRARQRCICAPSQPCQCHTRISPAGVELPALCHPEAKSSEPETETKAIEPLKEPLNSEKTSGPSDSSSSSSPVGNEADDNYALSSPAKPYVRSVHEMEVDGCWENVAVFECFEDEVEVEANSNAADGTSSSTATRKAIPRDLMANGLSPDTPYAFRVGVQLRNKRVVWGRVRAQDTDSEVLFSWSALTSGPNLKLSDDRLTVTNSVNKKWNSVRATTGCLEGKCSWAVRIDQCVSKNIFIGVVSKDATNVNYVGADEYGWGYLANMAMWHRKGKVKAYGELFKEGDMLEVHLDMDVGTLSFCRNGRNLGVAVSGLSAQTTGELFPAVSMYNKQDRVTLLPQGTGHNFTSGVDQGNQVASHSRSAVLTEEYAGTATALALVSNMSVVMDLAESMLVGTMPSPQTLQVAQAWLSRWNGNENGAEGDNRYVWSSPSHHITSQQSPVVACLIFCPGCCCVFVATKVPCCRVCVRSFVKQLGAINAHHVLSERDQVILSLTYMAMFNSCNQPTNLLFLLLPTQTVPLPRRASCCCHHHRQTQA
jgi:hypothetical protein